MKLWKNGYFHTMEDPQKTYHSMATDHGLIIGFDDEIKGLEFDREIDLNKAHVYPGFVDAHLHLLGYGQMLMRPNFSNIKGKEEALNELKKLFKNDKLFVEGYRECGITKDDLNSISKDYPILLRHNDYHSLTVNDQVLKLANIIHPTGVLTEEIAQHAIDSFPKYNKKEIGKILIQSLKSLYKYGVTGGHSDDLYYFNGFDETVSIFETVLDKFPFRAHLLMHHMVIDDFKKSGRTYLDQTYYLQLGAVKMFYDGTISSKTALMKKPYNDSSNYGLNVNGKEAFIEIVKKARGYHLPIAVHVIGDQGLDEVIEIIKAYPPKIYHHDRLIHTPWIAKETIEELKKLRVSLDIQPQFLSSDLPWALDFLSETPDLVFPWKTLLDAGLNLAGSSDAPIEIPNPLLGIHAAVFRESSYDHNPYFTEESLTRFEAITMYTKGANYSSEHTNRGYLKVGYVADLSIFKHDLLSMHPNKFKEDILEMTVIDERIVFDKNKSSV
ncbi:MAG: amidohydrolase [Acholeplasmataceae bacterium]|nr:amidohydrolase [Acholeplasmataceae bacterium]